MINGRRQRDEEQRAIVLAVMAKAKAKAEKRKSARKRLTIHGRLKRLEPEVRKHAEYDMKGEGVYLWVARSSLIKAFEFAKYTNGINEKRVNEATFFAASALRGICEDVIALGFLHQLSKELRDEVLGIELMLGIQKTTAEQAKFFKSVRPFQPVL